MLPHPPPRPPDSRGPLPLVLHLVGTWLCYALCWVGAVMGAMTANPDPSSAENLMYALGMAGVAVASVLSVIGLVMMLAGRRPGRGGAVVNVASFVLLVLGVLVLLVPMVLLHAHDWWHPVANPLTLATAVAIIGSVWAVFAALGARAR